MYSKVAFRCSSLKKFVVKSVGLLVVVMFPLFLSESPPDDGLPGGRTLLLLLLFWFGVGGAVSFEEGGATVCEGGAGGKSSKS